MGLENKRNQIRIRVVLPVEVFDIAKQKNFTGRIIDISVGGVSMVTVEELPVNTPVSLTFSIEENVYKRLPADVVREEKKQNEQFLGIAFFDLDAQAQNKLDLTIRKIHSKIKRGLHNENT